MSSEILSSRDATRPGDGNIILLDRRRRRRCRCFWIFFSLFFNSVSLLLLLLIYFYSFVFIFVFIFFWRPAYRRRVATRRKPRFHVTGHFREYKSPRFWPFLLFRNYTWRKKFYEFYDSQTLLPGGGYNVRRRSDAGAGDGTVFWRKSVQDVFGVLQTGRRTARRHDFGIRQRRKYKKKKKIEAKKGPAGDGVVFVSIRKHSSQKLNGKKSIENGDCH